MKEMKEPQDNKDLVLEILKDCQQNAFLVDANLAINQINPVQGYRDKLGIFHPALCQHEEIEITLKFKKYL